MNEWLLLLLSVGLVLACGGFVAAEFAFVTVDRASVDRAAETGDRKAVGTRAALRTLSTQLSGAQLGITITNLAIGFLAEPAVARLVRGPLRAVGVPDGAVPGVSLTVALMLATAVTMVFGELVPKNLAIARPLATARSVQRFQRGFTRSTRPVLRFMNGTANRILHLLGIEPQEELASARTGQELSSLVRRSAERGTLEAATADLLQRSLSFGEKRAGDVRTHRTRMTSLQADEPVADVITLTRETGHSRFPVLGSDGDEVAGVVHVKHAVGVPLDRRTVVTVGEVMVEPVVVPDTLELDLLLETLRGSGLQIAVVVDEFGGTDGIVTLEDLVEELVGDVLDEHDRPGARAARRGDGRWTLQGVLRPDEVGDLTGVGLPEHRSYETVGGLVARELGRLPAVGDEVVVTGDLDGQPSPVRLAVAGMDGRRVDRVVLEMLLVADAAPEGELCRRGARHEALRGEPRSDDVPAPAHAAREAGRHRTRAGGER